jgi:hypothetical protein
MQASIVIVSYNCRERLRRCLESVARHGPEVQHEVIVVDNASGDGTPQMADTDFPWAVLKANSENVGFAAAVNQGVARTRGDTILLLNPDCEIAAGTLDHLCRFLKERPWVGACGPRLLDDAGAIIRSCRTFPSLWTVFCETSGLAQMAPESRLFDSYRMGAWNYAAARAVDWMSGAALAFRRKTWDRVGGFDETFFIYAEELDWQMRLALAALDRWYVPEATVVHREGGSWGEMSQLRALWAHWGLWHYLHKHQGRACEAAARVLTACGSAARGMMWQVAALAGRRAETARAKAELHWAVARQCVTGHQPPKPGGATSQAVGARRA